MPEYLKNVPVTIPFKRETCSAWRSDYTYSDFERINEQIPEADAKYKIREIYAADLSDS